MISSDSDDDFIENVNKLEIKVKNLKADNTLWINRLVNYNPTQEEINEMIQTDYLIIDSQNQTALSAIVSRIYDIDLQFDIIKKLINYGTNIHHVHRGATVLIKAMINKFPVNIIQFLIDSGANVQGNKSLKASPLIIAKSQGTKSVEYVKLLLDNGADIDYYCEHSKHTALTVGIMHKDLYEVTKLLVDAKPNIDKHVGIHNWNPLLTLLALNDNSDIIAPSFSADDLYKTIKLLINYGFDVNHKDTTGRNALMYITNDKNIDIAKLLIEHGTDLNAKDNNDNTILHRIFHRFETRFYGECIILQLLKLYLECGADLTVKNNNNLTPLGQYRSDQEIEEYVINIPSSQYIPEFKSYIIKIYNCIIESGYVFDKN